VHSLLADTITMGGGTERRLKLAAEVDPVLVSTMEFGVDDEDDEEEEWELEFGISMPKSVINN
jgi:hypothetical protein